MGDLLLRITEVAVDKPDTMSWPCHGIQVVITENIPIHQQLFFSLFSRFMENKKND